MSFVPLSFRNSMSYSSVFEILIATLIFFNFIPLLFFSFKFCYHALELLKFLNDALRFLGFCFFLCLFFSFFSLFSFSLSSISVVTETMLCFLLLPSHLVCRFLLLLLLLLFFWRYLCVDRISLFPFSVDAC